MEFGYAPAIVVAVVVTVLELTEVVALVFALSAEHHTVRHGAAGAIAGVALVAVVGLVAGAALAAVPIRALLWASAAVLGGFGLFLFRSTVKTYRRRQKPATPTVPSTQGAAALQFAGGFGVGAVETTEAVIVLLALTARGYGGEALLGAVGGGLALVVAAALVHERIRRVKVPWLKLGATSLVFAFAVFWAGEAAGFAWPLGDVALLGLFAVGLVLVRAGVELVLRGDRARSIRAGGQGERSA